MIERSRRNVVRLGVLLVLVLLSLLLLAVQWEPDPAPRSQSGAPAVQGRAQDIAEDAGAPVRRRSERVHVAATRPGSPVKAGAATAAPTESSEPVACSVTATVTDAAGGRIAGASVELRHDNPAYPLDESRWQWKQTTDDAGQAEVKAPMAGYYQVRARAGEGACLPVDINLSQGGHPVLLVIRPAAVLTGRVRERGGEVVDGARLTLTCLSEARDVRRIVGTTADDGTFTVAGVQVENLYQVDVVVSIAGRQDQSFRFRRDDLPSPPHLDIVLTDVSVTGRVVSEEGTPVAGANVFFGRTRNVRTTSGRDGSFAIDLMPEHAGRAIVHAPPHAPLGITLPEPDSRGELRLGDVVLSGGQVLEGWVVDATGRPVTGVNVGLHVFADNGSLADTARVDERGHFRFEHVGPGPHRVSVQPGEVKYVAMPAVLDGVEAGDTGLRIVLPSYGLVELVIDGETRFRRDVVRTVTVTLTEPGTETSRGDLDVFGATGQTFAAPVGVYDLHVRSESFRDHVVPGVQIRPASESRTLLPLERDSAE